MSLNNHLWIKKKEKKGKYKMDMANKSQIKNEVRNNLKKMKALTVTWTDILHSSGQKSFSEKATIIKLLSEVRENV